MKKFEVALLIGLVSSVFISGFTAFARECDVLASSVLRLHILANSDSEADQALKLEVRDALLAHAPELFEGDLTREQAIEHATLGLKEIEEIAAGIIAEHGDEFALYGVKAEVVNMYFPTRRYTGFDLPAGRYDALRVTIGEGAGQNWWCMLFPPMCVQSAAERPGEDVYERVMQLGETPAYEPKLAIVEFINSLKESA